jgi:hypothetical protein
VSSIFDKVETGRKVRPRKILVYGEHGVGKTTWACKFPNPVVLATEDGSSDIDVARIRLQSATEALQAAADAPRTDFDTIVVDSVDWFEKLLEEMLHSEGFPTDFGKGTMEVARRVGRFLAELDKCVDAGKTVVLIAHSEVRKVEDVSGQSWDRLQPKLGKKACARVLEWADEVLLARIETFVTKKDEGFGRERGVATTTGRRILKSDSHPSYVAKRRISLSDEIDMNDPITSLFFKEN